MSKAKNQPLEKAEVMVEPNETNSEAVETTPEADKRVGFVYRVSASQGLNLRADPGFEHRVLKVIPFGSVLEARGNPVTVNGSDWIPVQDGWVAAAYLTQIETEV